MLRSQEDETLFQIARAVEVGLASYVHRFLPPDGRLVFDVPESHSVLGYMDHGVIVPHHMRTSVGELYPVVGTFSCVINEESLRTEDVSNLSAGWIHGIANNFSNKVLRVVESDKQRLSYLSPHFKFVTWSGCLVEAQKRYDLFTIAFALKLKFRTYVCGPIFEEAITL